MTDREARSEAARRKILASGNQDLIDRLHLIDAAAAQPAAAAGRKAAGPSLRSPLETVALVAGGVWLGNLLAGLSIGRELQAAFATVVADAGFDPAELGLGPDILAAAGLDSAAHDAAAFGSDLLDDFGLGDLDDFLDI